MTDHFNRIAVVTVLLALLALSWWLPNAFTGRVPLLDGDRRHDPDYTIENFTAISMDASGWRKHELRAVRLEHYPDDDSIRLEKPYLVQYTPNAAPVHTRADRGTSDSEGKEILMQGNVRVTRGASGSDPAGQIQAEEMRVLLE